MGYVNNRVCHIRLLHAIETGQWPVCCQIDAALLLVVHIPQHASINFPYVAPLLTYTQLPYLIQIMHVLITVSSISLYTCA